MLKIDNSNISITRGDSAYIQFRIKVNGQEAQLSAKDVIRCQVRQNPDEDLAFDGDILRDYNDSTMIVWHIKPEDTADLDTGTYFWDAQVEYENGDIYTFVNLSKFNILPEITMIE